MARYEIIKERSHLMAPNINIGVSFQVLGDVTRDCITQAIVKAIHANEILFCKIIMEEDGTAFYETMPEPVIYIETVDEKAEELIRDQQRQRFEITQGELIRFFLMPIEQGYQITFVAHHLAGDGKSMMYLIEDIMTALSGEEVPWKPVRLITKEQLPKSSRLSVFMRMSIRMLHIGWHRHQKVFGQQEYVHMFDSFWKEREQSIFTYRIARENMERLHQACEAHQVTMNSLFVTVFAQIIGGVMDIGIGVNQREAGYKGMGNYSSGVSIAFGYDYTKEFWENVRMVHSMIHWQLDHPADRFFMNQFLFSISPTLLDSAYYYAFDGFQNRTAARISKMFGFTRYPEGISVSNLTTADLKECYGSYKVKSLMFVPPLVMNSNAIFGIVTHAGELSITMNVETKQGGEEKQRWEEKKGNFDKMIHRLLHIVE